MNIAIIGTGHVGLITGACLADAGNDVLCVDVDAKKIEGLKQGIIPIHEPGLDALIKTNAEAERLRFTTSAAEGVAHGQLQLIAVGTPPDEDGSADLKYILGVAKDLGKLIKPGQYKVIVDKSTVPVGTAEKVEQEIIKSSGGIISSGEDAGGSGSFAILSCHVGSAGRRSEYDTDFLVPATYGLS